MDNNNTIKKKSPFTKNFKGINDRVRSIISETESIYYNPQFIDHVSDTSQASIPSKTLKGDVQDSDCDQNLQISLNSETHLTALNRIKKIDRIIHIDPTRKPVTIPKYMRDYKQIMNYAFLVKDASDLDRQGLIESRLLIIQLLSH